MLRDGDLYRLWYTDVSREPWVIRHAAGAGMVVDRGTPTGPASTAGIVLRQNPQAGFQIAPGEPISIEVPEVDFLPDMAVTAPLGGQTQTTSIVARPNAGQLTSTRLTGLGMGSSVTQGTTVYGGGITYANFEMLSLYLGSGADAFEVISTHAGETLIDLGGGNDAAAVRRVLGHTTILGATGNDTITLGSANVAMTSACELRRRPTSSSSEPYRSGSAPVASTRASQSSSIALRRRSTCTHTIGFHGIAASSTRPPSRQGARLSG